VAIGAAAAIVPMLAATFVFWRASRARDEAQTEVAADSEYRFQAVSLPGLAPAGFESIAANPQFRDITLFQDAVVVSARAGLFFYDRGGVLRHAYRVGLELPPAELGAISAGPVPGSGQTELFIATHGEGLLAFDGTRFRQILPEDPNLRNTTAVLALKSGRVLIGTERKGLVVFDGHRLTPFHSKLKSAYITAVAGEEGDLWIGTLASGLFHYHGGELDDLAATLPDPQVLSILVGFDAVYAGTPMGVVELRGGRRIRTIGDGFFARTIARRGDALQVGTEDEGIVSIPLGQGRPSGFPRHGRDWSAAIQEPVVRLATLGDESYAITENAIYRFDAHRDDWQPAVTAAGSVLADRNISALAVAGGRLWVGYFDRGLDLVQPDFARAEHHEDDVLFCVNRIVPDPSDQKTAVATANGLAMFDASGQLRQVMGRKDGLLADHVTDVAFREGGMVVATPAGLSFVDRTGVRSLYVFHGLVNNHVYTVAASGKQVLAGTLGGVSVLNDDIVRANYTTANSHLRHNWITALVQVGDEWFAGTYGAGVLRLDSAGDWRTFPDLKSGFIVNPNAMLVTPDRVYAGSLDRGLFVFERSSGRWRNATVGLPSLNVTALAYSGGYLYVGTDNGLVRVSEGGLE
jgi:ligand-binding sensor domain-containing protein